MTHDERLEAALAYWTAMGNTPEELGELLAEATFSIPQRGWYSDEYVRSERMRINSARYMVRQLPYGREILEREEKLMR